MDIYHIQKGLYKGMTTCHITNREPTVEEVVNSAWNKAKCSGRTMMQALEQVHGDQQRWDRKVLKNPGKE